MNFDAGLKAVSNCGIFAGGRETPIHTKTQVSGDWDYLNYSLLLLDCELLGEKVVCISVNVSQQC